MTPLNILVIGRHADIVETVLRLINNQPGWSAQGALTDEEAIRVFSSHSFDLVLLGGGLGKSSEEKISKDCRAIRPDVKIVQHFGGGSGLLFNEIMEAMSTR